MAKKIKAIVKRVDEPYGHMTWISNTLENLQRTVGGYIETISLPGGAVIICDEEGRLKKKPRNCYIFPYRTAARLELVGDIIVVGSEGDEFADVPIDFKTWKKIYLGLEDGK